MGDCKDYNYALEIMAQELNNKYISPEIKYAFEASIKALEKQIPKKPLKSQKYKGTWYICPNCNHEWGGSHFNCCTTCGQKLDWD